MAREPYMKIPLSWASNPALTARDFRIAIIVFSHGEECWPAIPTVAKTAKVSVSTVQRTLRKFEKLGLIVASPRYLPNGAQGSNLYSICYRGGPSPRTTLTEPPGSNKRKADRQTTQGTDKRTDSYFKEADEGLRRVKERMGWTA